MSVGSTLRVSMKIRGILPTNRPDDIPYEHWRNLTYGKVEELNRAMARVWLSSLIPAVRWVLRLRGPKRS